MSSRYLRSIDRDVNPANSQRIGYTSLANAFLYLSLPMLVVTIGCGESRLEVNPVSGKVTYNGQVPVGAKVILHAMKPSEEGSVAPIGTVGSDGSFEISAYKKGDGAPPGEYVATIQWYKFIPEDGGPGPDVMPKEYSNPKTSPIKVTVGADGPTQLEPIVISSTSEKSARRGVGGVARR